MQHNTGKTRSTSGIEWEVVCMLEGFTRAEAYTVERYLKRGNTRKKRAEFYAYAMDPHKDESTAFTYYCSIEHACWRFKRNGEEI